MTAEALIAAARAAGIDRVVQVTPSPLGYDNRYSFEGAQQHPHAVAGVIGRFDAFAPHLAERLRKFMRQPAAVGVRFTLHHDWAAGWLHAGKLDALFAAAQQQGVPVFLYAPDQCEQLDRVALQFPELKLVVDHTALRHGPGRNIDTNFAQWPQVIALARRPNVWMKVSYFPEAVAEYEPYPFPTAQRRFSELFEAVGPDRMMWGSNFPVVSHLCPYEQALDFVRSACEFLGAADRDAILGGNFMRAFAPAAARAEPT
jgi:predicted TIM-barrel fold metal-dependent hydrolase